MKPSEWLFVGGPADGKKIFVKAGVSVRWPGQDGKHYLYKGQDYVHCGNIYRIGVLSADDANPSQISKMIDELRPEPVCAV